MRPIAPFLAACFTFLSIALSQTATLPGDLIGHWPLDTDAHSSVGGWTGTIQSDAQVGAAGAMLGNGCYFRNSGDGYVQTDLTGPSGSAARTISIWFRTAANVGDLDAMCGWGQQSTGKRYDFRLHGGDLRIEISGTGKTMPLASHVNDGQWHHALLSFAGGNFSSHTLYVDGKLAGTTSDTSATVNTGTSKKLRIGTGVQRTQGGSNARDFDGWLDDLGIFDHALPAADAALIHGLGRFGVDLSELGNARILWAGTFGGTQLIGGRTWAKASGLGGLLGDLGGSTATNDAFIVLDGAGNGISMESFAPLSDLLLDPPGPFRIDLGFGFETVLPLTLTNRSASLASVWEFIIEHSGTPAKGPDWIRPAPSAGRLPAGQSTSIDCRISADGLGSGSHEARFAVVPAGTAPADVPPSAWRSLVLTVSTPSFSLDQESIAISRLMGLNPNPVEVHAIPADSGTPVSGLTAHSSDPWLVATISPTEPATIVLESFVSGFAPGTYFASVTVSNADTLRLLEVEVHVAALNITGIKPDPNQPDTLYAINYADPEISPCQLLRIDGPSGVITDAIDVGFNATDFDIDPGLNRLYVANYQHPVTQVVDLGTFAPLPPLTLDTDIYRCEVDGRGRLYGMSARRQEATVWDLDTSTTVEIDVYMTSGDGEIDLAGRFLYHVYSEFGQYLTKVDLATDPASLVVRRERTSGAEAPVILSADGSRIIVGRNVFDTDTRLQAVLPGTVHSISPGAELAVGEDKVWWLDSGIEAFSLPVHGDVSSFTTDSRHLVLFNAAGPSLHSIPVSTITTLPAPWPRPGQEIHPGPITLTWAPVAQANSYTLVIEGGPHGPVSFGSIPEPFFTPPSALPYGRIYRWRVDALTPSGVVVGDTWQFSVGFPQGPAIEGADESTAGRSVSFGRGFFVIGSEGAATVHTFDPATGANAPKAMLALDNHSNSNLFGSSVAAHDTDIFVGAPRYHPTENSAGAFFAYRHDADGDPASLGVTTAPEPRSHERFATGLATAGDLVMAGTYPYWGAPGRVVACLTQPAVIETQIIQPDDSGTGNEFGRRIAMSGNTALIAASGTGNSSPRVPNAYVFNRNPTTGLWEQTQKLILPGVGDKHTVASSIALNNDVIAINNDTDDQVILFTLDSGNRWIPVATIDATSVPGSSNTFATSVALHGDLLFVGDRSARINGIGGGAVFTFRRSGNTWLQGPTIAPDALERSNFGTSLAARDGWLLVGGGGDIWLFPVDPAPNHSPFFTSPVPSRAVSGRQLDAPVRADDPDGNIGLTTDALQLPPWLSLTDHGSGGATLSGLPDAASGTTHDVQLRVTDSAGASTLRTFRLTVLTESDGPIITGHPSDADLAVGQEAILHGTVEGAGPFHWQWMRNGLAIPGANQPSLVISEIDLEDAGSYSFSVTNPVATAHSNPATVTVRPSNRFAGPWPTFGGAPRHAGMHPATLSRHTFVPAWEVEVDSQGGTTHRPAIGEGKVFVSPYHNGRGQPAMALDLATGHTLWTHGFDAAHSINPASYHDGRVYIQRCNNANNELWCLDAQTGATLWSSPYTAQWFRFEAPTVTDDGVWINGGYSCGMYGFDTDGTRRFFRELHHIDGWTPTVSDGRLLTSLEASFSVSDPTDGTLLWSIGTTQSGTSVPAVSGHRAIVKKGSRLICFDLASRSIAWESEEFSGPRHAAVSRGTVYALSSDVVRTYSLADGSPDRVFETGAGSNLSSEQPLLLNDHLVVATDDRTFIFALESGNLVQSLAGGGKLCYADGHLIAAGNDGRLRAYFANAAPEFAPSMPPEIDAGAAAADLAMALAPLAGDPDAGDSLIWAIVSVSRPEIFHTLDLDPVTGDLTVIYNPWQSGSSDVTISITDSAGNVTRATITFTVPDHPEPQLDIAATLVLNRQTGLYEHTITVTNSAAREVAGFDLTITGLPEGVCVNNASDCTGGTTTIHHRQPLAAGAAVTLVLEYFASARGTVLEPQVAVSLVTEPDTDPAAPDGGLAVDRCMRQADGSLLIEFTATSGALYEVHYSDDGENWKLSPVRVRAAGNRVQWIDRGPPRTDSPPSAEPCRFYRVREITES